MKFVRSLEWSLFHWIKDRGIPTGSNVLVHCLNLFGVNIALDPNPKGNSRQQFATEPCLLRFYFLERELLRGQDVRRR